MRYSAVSVAVLALASSVVGQFFDNILTPTRDEVLNAGEPFDITWAPEGVDGTIKLILWQGKDNLTLQTGPTIKSGVNNLDGKYTWSPTDNGHATYGIYIEHEQKKDLTQLSPPFHIKGAAGSSTTTIKLSTGPSYTSTSTSSVPSSTVTVVSTSSSSANITSTTALPTANVTLSTTLTTPRTTGSPTTTGPASASSSAVNTPGAAVANLANGGLAVIGGLVLAFAL